MRRLDGKVAIITGAARGLGEAEARRFAAEGARVVLADVRDDLGEKVASGLGEHAAYFHLDVTQPANWSGAVDFAVARFGTIDVLVNNAGVMRAGMIDNQPLEDYLTIITVNQVGCFLGMQSVVPTMKAAGTGVIVNTSSIMGLIGGAAMTAYTASKFAVRGMTKAAAAELGPFGIRVNSLHPGGMDTPMTREFFGDVDVTNGGDAPGLARVALGRIGEPDEIAGVALFLASDDASYCTGAEFVVDGGLTSGL